MEVLILIAIVVIAIIFFKSPSNKESTSEQAVPNKAEQLLERSFKINKQLAKLSTESVKIISNLQASDSDMRRHEKLKLQMEALDREAESIKTELSKIN